MTTVVITRNSSPFAGYGQANLHCRSSTFSTDRLEEAQIRWWAFKDGVLQDSMYVGGGAPDFGIYVTPGDWTVVCEMLAAEDSGTWQSATETWTVSAPTYQAECWLDLDAGTDGSGTIGSPFNDPASAETYILANHVDGATNQSAIHVKRGTTWSGSTAVFTTGTGMQGRVVVDTYDSGAVPTFTTTTTSPIFQFQDECGCALIDLGIYGNYAGGASGSQAGVQRTMDMDGTHTGGANILLHNVTIEDVTYGGITCVYGSQSSGFPTSGNADWFCIDDVSISNTGFGAVFGAGVRYLTVADTTFGSLATENNFRFSQGGSDVSIRNVTWTGYPASGANSHFRFHANGGSVTERVSVVGCFWDSQDPQFSAYWLTGADAGGTTRYMQDIWLVGCTIENSAPAQNGQLTWEVAYRGVIRGNKIRNSANIFFGTRSRSIGSLDGTATLITDGADHWFEANSIYSVATGLFTNGFINYTSGVASGLRFRNNVIRMDNTGNPKVLNGGGRAYATFITASDNNWSYIPNQTSGVQWATNFSDVSSNATLATWNSTTGFDGNSTCSATSTEDPDWVDPSATPMDLDIQSTSPLIGAGADLVWLGVDANGHVRSSTYDIGADDYGVSTAPTEPTIGGGGTPPNAPTDGAASNATPLEISVSWTDNSDDETAFVVERSATGSGGWSVLSAAVPANSTSYVDDGLTAGVTWYYRVKATNADGDSAYTEVVSATVLAEPSPPDAPTGAAADDSVPYEITVSWVDNSDDETAFVIERSPAGAGTWTVLDAAIAPNSTSYVDDSLMAGTSWDYRVKATNADGDSAYTDVVSGTVAAAPAVASGSAVGAVWRAFR